MSKGGRKSTKAGKTESPEDERKAEGPKPKAGKKSQETRSKNHDLEAVNSPIGIPDSYRHDIPHSPINNSEIEHPTSEIKMDVHHHPQVEKKGLKEYLLEGLMIFLAVFMGFIAENVRGHISEQNRANEYAITLYSDLKSDTAELKDYLAYFRYATANTDTLMQLLSAAAPKQIPSGKLYWFGLFGGAYHIFTPQNATLDEMKSSGALRFFGDKAITRKLAVYDELCENTKVSEEKDNGIYVETRKARAKIFEFKYNEIANDIYHGMNNADPYSLHIASRWAKADSFKKSNPPLLSYDETLFNEYLEMVRSRFFYLKVSNADTLLHHATELIGLLKQKYDLQDQ